ALRSSDKAGRPGMDSAIAVLMKTQKPDTVTRQEWKRLQELASRNIYLGTAPYPAPTGQGDLEFLRLLRRCERAGATFPGMDQHEDDCPFCIEGMKMTVLEALDPELAAKRKFQDFKMSYDQM